MATPAPDETNSTEELWIEFDGTAAINGSKATLHPSIDPATEVELPAADVRIAGPRTSVRVGARTIRVTVPERSPFREGTRQFDAGRRRCGRDGSACFGGIEVCCDSGEVVGHCAGAWSC